MGERLAGRDDGFTEGLGMIAVMSAHGRRAQRAGRRRTDGRIEGVEVSFRGTAGLTSGYRGAGSIEVRVGRDPLDGLPCEPAARKGAVLAAALAGLGRHARGARGTAGPWRGST